MSRGAEAKRKSEERKELGMLNINEDTCRTFIYASSSRRLSRLTEWERIAKAAT